MPPAYPISNPGSKPERRIKHVACESFLCSAHPDSDPYCPYGSVLEALVGTASKPGGKKQTVWPLYSGTDRTTHPGDVRQPGSNGLRTLFHAHSHDDA